ncbi:MAG: hypothetical protein L0I62_02580 [Gammaproteobacteria bacterium]|nr:hypothetical protein [Gammaproteobacteria bacterium]
MSSERPTKKERRRRKWVIVTAIVAGAVALAFYASAYFIGPFVHGAGY